MEHCEFFVNRPHRYCGASSLSDLKTIVSDSILISCSMVFQPSTSISVPICECREILQHVTIAEKC